MKPTPEPTPDQDGLAAIGRMIERLEKHTWGVVAVVPALVVIKVLRVAEADLGTAQVILGASGVAGLTSLVLLSVIPAALLVGLLFAGLSLGGITKANAPKVISIVGVLALASCFFTPLPAVLLAAGLGLLGGGWRLRKIRRRKDTATDEIASKGWPGVAFMAGVGAVVGAVVSAGVCGAMWAPAEHITLETQPTPVVGYVLSDDGNRTVVLLEADRTTVAYRSEEIEERQRCQLPGSGSWLFRTPSGYEACPG